MNTQRSFSVPIHVQVPPASAGFGHNRRSAGTDDIDHSCLWREQILGHQWRDRGCGWCYSIRRLGYDNRQLEHRFNGCERGNDMGVR